MYSYISITPSVPFFVCLVLELYCIMSNYISREKLLNMSAFDLLRSLPQSMLTDELKSLTEEAPPMVISPSLCVPIKENQTQATLIEVPVEICEVPASGNDISGLSSRTSTTVCLNTSPTHSTVFVPESPDTSRNQLVPYVSSSLVTVSSSPDHEPSKIDKLISMVSGVSTTVASHDLVINEVLKRLERQNKSKKKEKNKKKEKVSSSHSSSSSQSSDDSSCSSGSSSKEKK
jgi:hypothetical protein